MPNREQRRADDRDLYRPWLGTVHNAGNRHALLRTADKRTPEAVADATSRMLYALAEHADRFGVDLDHEQAKRTLAFALYVTTGAPSASQGLAGLTELLASRTQGEA